MAAADVVKYSQYYNELSDSTAKTRYREKINECGGVDPFSKTLTYVDDVSLWPSISNMDIVNYLVFTTSFVTGKQMKAYKSLNSYNFFISGWVRTILVMAATKDRRILHARVNHSQRCNETPVKTWILTKVEGEVITAHCDCMAGLSEVCSHVGAVLFAVEAAVRMRDQQTCTEKGCQWLLPSSMKQVPYVEVREINFASASKRKKETDVNMAAPDPLRNNIQLQKQDGQPTDAEKSSFFEQVSAAGHKSAILSLIPSLNEDFVPTQKLPGDLTSLFDVEAMELPYDKLLVHCQDLKKQICVTPLMIPNVEKVTHNQSGSKEWFTYRSGRVTASRFKSACHTDPANPSISLIKAICYPHKYQFSSKATRWGCDHEKQARDLYTNIQAKQHSDLSVKDCGLYLNTNHPFLGASPDGVVHCKCCGNGVCEVKCPFCFKEDSIRDTAQCKMSCLNENDNVIALDKNHAYYYQVQAQIFICDVNYCDFIVFTEKEILIERIYPDHVFWTEASEKADQFVDLALLPELVANWYTRQTIQTPEAPALNGTTFCYCRGEEAGTMVGCDNPDCSYQWFHIDCLGLKQAPKGRFWMCPTCRKDQTAKKSKRN